MWESVYNRPRNNSNGRRQWLLTPTDGSGRRKINWRRVSEVLFSIIRFTIRIVQGAAAVVMVITYGSEITRRKDDEIPHHHLQWVSYLVSSPAVARRLFPGPPAPMFRVLSFFIRNSFIPYSFLLFKLCFNLPATSVLSYLYHQAVCQFIF